MLHRCELCELHCLPHKALFVLFRMLIVICKALRALMFNQNAGMLLRTVPPSSYGMNGCSLPHKLCQWEAKWMPQTRHLFDQVLADHGKLLNICLLGVVIRHELFVLSISTGFLVVVWSSAGSTHWLLSVVTGLVWFGYVLKGVQTLVRNTMTFYYLYGN